MRRRVLLAVLCLALAAPPAVAKPAPRLPALAGTTKVTVPGSMVIDVRLPKTADVGDFTVPKGASVTGPGRIVGAMLLEASGKTAGLAFLKFGFCSAPGCAGTQPYLYYRVIQDPAHSGDTKIPPGDYRLVLVTDGKPVTMVMKFKGLSGSTTLRPTRRIAVRQMNPDYLPGAVSPVNTLYSGAVDADIDGGQGIVLHQFQVTTEVAAQHARSFCLYSGADSAVQQPAPECPGGHGNDFSQTIVTTEQRYLRMNGFEYYLADGHFRAGHYYRTVGTAHDPVGTVTWIVVPPR